MSPSPKERVNPYNLKPKLNMQRNKPMRKHVQLTTLILLPLAIIGCGGDATDSTGAPTDAVVEINQEDIVMTAPAVEEAPAAATTPTSPAVPGIPGAAPTSPTGQSQEEQLLSSMTAAEKADYEKQMEGINSSAEGETANFSIIRNDVQAAVESYYDDNRKLPSSLQVLVSEGYLSAIPRLPKGKSIRIDGKTLEVTVE